MGLLFREIVEQHQDGLFTSGYTDGGLDQKLLHGYMYIPTTIRDKDLHTQSDTILY